MYTKGGQGVGLEYHYLDRASRERLYTKLYLGKRRGLDTRTRHNVIKLS